MSRSTMITSTPTTLTTSTRTTSRSQRAQCTHTRTITTCCTTLTPMSVTFTTAIRIDAIQGVRPTMRHRFRSSRRLVCVVALATTVFAVAANTAGAHVDIEPTRAKAGSTTAIVVSPLNEEDDAGTTKVEVLFPSAYPIAS